jgi:hypothetical protein
MKMNPRIPTSIRHLVRKKPSLVWNRPDLYIAKPRNVTSESISNYVLQPLIDWLEMSPGYRAELFRMFNAEVTANIPLIMIVRWTHKNPSKRTEPPYGYGLILTRIIQDLQEHAAAPPEELEPPEDHSPAPTPPR